ncbi:MAG: BatD family protein [Bacteroidales bacterium]|nr:BatD family protein [Bacteroidales bacterium]
MVGDNWKYVWGFLLLLFWQGAFAQGHLFSDVKLNQSSVYVGQPVEVTVLVYTSTWFTRGLDPGNIKVNGAFTVYFRSVSSSKQINGKTYAGVEMIFYVIPYDDEDILFPSLDIKVETPDEGGYKGVQRVIKIKARKIIVKPVPPGYNKTEWLVASGMTVKESWSGDKTRVKVGDVLERSIHREVSGTVSELIPPINWDSLSGVSLYPARSEVNNHKSRTAISASRTDGIRYLFEKEGEVTIPEKVLTWWNPVHNKLYKRTLQGFTIDVLPNPDLGMLESVRDSLAVQTAGQGETTGDKSAITILGVSLKWFIAGLLGLVVIIFLLINGIKPIRRIIIKRREQYRNSELYYFRHFKKASKRQDPDKAVQALYRWIDQLDLKEPTLQYFATNYGTTKMVREVKLLEQHINSSITSAFSFNFRAWSGARKNCLNGELQAADSRQTLWINPHC